VPRLLRTGGGDARPPITGKGACVLRVGILGESRLPVHDRHDARVESEGEQIGAGGEGGNPGVMGPEK